MNVVPLLLAATVFAVVFAVLLRLMPGGRGEAQIRVKKTLQRLEGETAANLRQADAEISVIRHYRLSESEVLDRLLRAIPGMEKLFSLLLKSGLKISMIGFLGIMVALPAVFCAIASTFEVGLPVFGLAAAAGLWLPIKYLQRRIAKRNEKFVQMFPDAVDMIVRSVRSGHPLQAALKMIAENMDPPVSTEFKQVVDEIAYGRTLSEALIRLSQRLQESDLTFFVVVASVQQETGGNLAEVLSNLSGIIRKRKQVRLKIKALTSEGRMTAIILGSLPFILFGVLKLLSPTYLDPLFDTETGQFILWLAGGMVFAAFTIVRRLINIDV